MSRISHPAASRPSLSDVARAAGVSKTTASYVLSKKNVTVISQDTRKRVIDVARRLGYRPNALARSLRRRASLSLGLISPAFPNSYVTDVIKSLYALTRQGGYHVLLEPYQASESWSQVQALDNLLDRMVDGVFVFWPSRPWVFPDDVYARIVLVDTPEPTNVPPGSDRVVVDRASGIDEATRYLLARGRRRIALVVDTRDDQITRDKIHGWREAHRRTGAATGSDLLIRIPDPEQWNIRQGLDLGRRLAAMNPRPDAVIATDDLLAIGVVKQLIGSGLDVPGQMAVVGLGGYDICEMAPVALASVAFPSGRIADEAARMMLDGLQAGQDAAAAQRAVTLPMRFVQWASCG